MLTAQIFFGLWLVPLGYLAHKSGWFPKPVAVLLVVAAGCYLLDVLTAFLVPDFNQLIHSVVIIPVDGCSGSRWGMLHDVCACQ